VNSPQATDSQAAAIRRTLNNRRAAIPAAVRAFAVTVGPSAVLVASAAAAATSALRSLAHTERPRAGAALVVGAAAVHLGTVRPWMLNWGATAEEAQKPLPGDDLVPEVGSQSTRAITIHAAVTADRDPPLRHGEKDDARDKGEG
jgi:hypothetical protein